MSRYKVQRLVKVTTKKPRWENIAVCDLRDTAERVMTQSKLHYKGQLLRIEPYIPPVEGVFVLGTSDRA